MAFSIKIDTNGGVTSPKGFKANGIHCGIRKNKDKKDLMLILSETECDAAAVYTKNLVYGAPITVTRKNLENGKARAVICNSGIANTCNADGVEKAQATADKAVSLAFFFIVAPPLCATAPRSSDTKDYLQPQQSENKQSTQR